MSSFSKAKKVATETNATSIFNRLLLLLLLKHCTCTALGDLQSILPSIISFDTHAHPVGQVLIIIGIWKMKKFRHWKVKWLTQGCTVSRYA